MKKFSLIFTLVLLGSIVSSFFLTVGYCDWRTPTQLTSNSADNSSPAISGDGTKVVYQSNVDGDQEIFVIDSDGTNLTQLTNNAATDRNPSISNDGTKIAFESNVDGDWDIFVINSDGTGLTQLTSNTLADAYPAISGDGTKIVKRSNVGGTNELYMVNSDGSGSPTKITSNQATVWISSISGDGTKIAYISDVDGDREVFVINSDGSGLTQLTSNTADDNVPAISNDGTKVAFESIVDGDWDIFVINSDGTGLTQLTNNDLINRAPSISYDGSEIAYYSNADGDHEIFVMNTDGSGSPIKLSENIVTDADPSINGYGQKVAYMSGEGNVNEIFVVTQEDPSPPFDQMLSINDGAATTDSVSVTLTLSATDPGSGVIEMRLANEGEPWSDWMRYDTSKSWTLTSGDEEKRVWVEFRNGDGVVSTPATDTIMLDTTPAVNHDIVYDQVTYVVQTRSNSTLTDMTFSQGEKLLQFSVDGATGTAGFCDIAIPAELMSGTFSIFIDDVPLVENMDYTQTVNGTHYQFSITYDHSTHTIEIFSTNVIPELTSLMLISTFVIATAVILTYERKKSNKTGF
ncbi:MAG: hypothetical protein CW716_12615 [Candidatus Bathyarchaeum sp.]|nr:MAG: hypothetical protein CW716_12615 [Candidatus Bathyarchaeum sp.]